MQNITKIYTRTVLMIVMLFLLSIGCKKESVSKETFTPNFDFQFVDDNNVRFTNQSGGEYHMLNWNFGNGEKATTTDKNKQFPIYYREAGAYNVTLTLIGVEGDRKQTSKTVTIKETDFKVAFTAEIDTSDKNKVNLVNTTQGDYDSFKWIYRHRQIENQKNAVAYFPYAGSYDIELQVVKDDKTYSLSKTIKIDKNDPDYFSKFKLVWSDEFDGNVVNLNNWTFETGSHGWGNNELQNYTDGKNAKVKNGNLIITAQKINDNKAVGSYASTRMITKGKQEFTYGKMEINAKLPSGKGIWPAIWMLGANISEVSWPACGEIDIMEYVGYQSNTVHATVHTAAGYGSDGSGRHTTLETCEEEFHIYGVAWTEKELIFYTDSIKNVTHKYAPVNKNDENWPFNKPHFFILNIAVGGNWGGAQGIDNTIFPQTMQVDYVRVYQENNE